MSKTWSRFIADDLRAHPPPPGAPVTLASLAARYGVSATPVRRAVDELVAQGVLERTSGGRLVGAGASGAAPPPPAAPRPWEDALRREVLERALRGRDDFLREEALAARIGAGRTALRPALARLAGQGFLEHVPRRGWRVRPLRREDVADYLAVRERLELLALEQALPRLDRALLEEIRAGNDAAHLDNRLHAHLVERSGNRFVAEFFARSGPLFDALFDYAAPEADQVARMAGQHRAIVDALLAGDGERASSALSEHIRAQEGIVAALLARLRG